MTEFTAGSYVYCPSCCQSPCICIPMFIEPSKSPYKCPVCHGKGWVPQGFYDNPNLEGSYYTFSISPSPCRSCIGTGVLWG